MRLDKRIARARVKFFFVFGAALGYITKEPSFSMFCAMMGVVMPMAVIAYLFDCMDGYDPNHG